MSEMSLAERAARPSSRQTAMLERPRHGASRQRSELARANFLHVAAPLGEQQLRARAPHVKKGTAHTSLAGRATVEALHQSD